MNRIVDTVCAVLVVILFIAVCVASAWITIKQPDRAQRSCVVVSIDATLIPAKPNTITILRNGKRETCYIYKDTTNSNTNSVGGTNLEH